MKQFNPLTLVTDEIYRQAFRRNDGDIKHWYSGKYIYATTNGLFAGRWTKESFPFNLRLCKYINPPKHFVPNKRNMRGYHKAKLGAYRSAYKRGKNIEIQRVIADTNKTTANRKFIKLFKYCDFYIHCKDPLRPIVAVYDNEVVGLIMPIDDSTDWDKII